MWRKPLSTAGSYAFVFHNPNTGGGAVTGSFNLATDMQLTNAKGYNVYEAFTGALFGLYTPPNKFTCSVPPYGVCMIIVKPVP